jgi:hypothetical protein
MTENTERYANLEGRITALEQQRLHVVLSKLDGLAYGVNLVHEDVRALREVMGETKARFDKVDERLDGIDVKLSQHGELLDRIDAALTEILRRLPG